MLESKWKTNVGESMCDIDDVHENPNQGICVRVRQGICSQ
jgi:hypothetical protein